MKTERNKPWSTLINTLSLGTGLIKHHVGCSHSLGSYLRPLMLSETKQGKNECLPVRLAIVNNEQEQRILVKRLMGSATAWNGTGQNVQNIPFLVQNEARFGRDGGNLSPGN